jgi:PAS domain S-box-containing protein
MNYRAPGVPLKVYSYSICPLNLERDEAGAILVMDDVTDQLQLAEEVRRTQLHLASVVESAGDLIISADSSGAIVTWNAAAQQATGYSSSDVSGRQFADFIVQPDDSDAKVMFRDFAHMYGRQSIEWSMRCRDGQVIPVSWHVSPMTGSKGEVVGAVVVGRNLIEQRAMEEQIHQAEKLAALGRAIGGIAHEIRNPLGVSSAAAQLLQHNQSSPVLVQECAAKVIAGIDRASLVVESLLRFARQGRIYETARVDVLEVLKNALMLASGEAAPGTAVEWTSSSDPQPIYTEGVHNLIELVFINLILNAFQAMPNGGRMTIGTEIESREVVVSVGDTGAGIPDEHLSKIFDPFFTTRGDGRRSGLGLSLAHSIVKQHGGHLRVRTSLRRGTVFMVHLPKAREAPDEALPDRKKASA